MEEIQQKKIPAVMQNLTDKTVQNLSPRQQNHTRFLSSYEEMRKSHQGVMMRLTSPMDVQNSTQNLKLYNPQSVYHRRK